MVANCLLLLSMLPVVWQPLLPMVGGKPLRQACSWSKAAHFEYREEQVTLTVVHPRVTQLVDQMLHCDVARVESMHKLVSLRSRQKLCVQGHACQVLHL